jgi:hypothetical protein
MKSGNSLRRRRFFLDLAGCDVEGCEQGRRAMPLVVVAVPGQRPSVRQLQITLSTFERLDRRLLVDADDDRILGWCHIEADHISSLGGEIRIVALAPTLAAGEIDLLLVQEAPHVVHVDIAQGLGDQFAGPARPALRHRPIEHRQNALGAWSRLVSLRPSMPNAAKRVRQTLTTPVMTPTLRDRPRGQAIGGLKDNTDTAHYALLRGRCTQPTFALAARLRIEPDLSCFGNHPDVESQHPHPAKTGGTNEQQP